MSKPRPLSRVTIPPEQITTIAYLEVVPPNPRHPEKPRRDKDFPQLEGTGLVSCCCFHAVQYKTCPRGGRCIHVTTLNGSIHPVIQTATSIVDHLTSLLRYDVDGSVKIFFPSKRSASDDPGTQAAIRWRREIEPRLDEAKRTQGMRVVTFPSIYHVLANAEELRRDMAALGVEHFATTAETTA